MLYPAAPAPCRAHILTLAMTVYLRKENCPQGDGNGVREREVARETKGVRKGGGPGKDGGGRETERGGARGR